MDRAAQQAQASTNRKAAAWERRTAKFNAQCKIGPYPVPRAGRYYHDVDWHQCPPPHARTLPVGTKVHVKSSAEHRTRVRAEPTAEESSEGEWHTWWGVIVGRVEESGDYEVANADDRRYGNGVNPYARPHGTVRVPWQAMLVIGAPASGEGGAPTAAWAPYAQQRAAERAQRGRSNSWSEEMERANEAERAKSNKRKAEALLLTAYGEPGEASVTEAEYAGVKRRRSGEHEGASRARAAEAGDGEASTQTGGVGSETKTKQKKARKPRSAERRAKKAERTAKRCGVRGKA